MAQIAKVVLNHLRDTKNTSVFVSDNDQAAVTQLYVKKSAFNGTTPKTVTLTLE